MKIGALIIPCVLFLALVMGALNAPDSAFTRDAAKRGGPPFVDVIPADVFVYELRKPNPER